VIQQLQDKINEKDKKDEKILELAGRIKFEQSKRVDLEIKISKMYTERKLFKKVIGKLKDDVMSYRQATFDDVKKVKMLEKLNETLE